MVRSAAAIATGACVFVIAGMVSSASAAKDHPADADAIAKALANGTAAHQSCTSDDPGEVVVCGRAGHAYRIDPSVLAATRRAEALPPKPPLDAGGAATPCTGSQCGGGSFVPLIPMALKALKAAELAADGDDWREAFRTRPDQYQAYQRARDAKKGGGVSVGVTVGNQ